MGTFGIRGDQFELNGAPTRLLSGAMHYFRVVPEYWEDRLRKLRLMGLNTLETYVAWNAHEPRPGEFCFDGGLDIVRYIRMAGDVGLQVIVRPGPYICSEWELGGLPSWLLADPGMRLRCNYAPYLAAVDRFYHELLPRLAPLQIGTGGPIIAMQVENEYGSYGNDKAYLSHLESTMRAEGVDVLLFTSDGPTDVMLQYGTLPEIFKTVNFGSRAGEAFGKLAEYQSQGPRMCMEFWNGWFDHWGEDHHTRQPEDAAAALDEQLALGASVNFYMFHGGTNFGFFNGANYGEHYQPTITSYDDDAPLSEHGEITPKFHAFREVIGRYVDLPPFEAPEPIRTMQIARFELAESAALFDCLPVLSRPVKRATPEPMEYLGQDYGFILYETEVSGPREEAMLHVRDCHDRAHVFQDGTFLGILDRESGRMSLQVTVPKGGSTLRILVENMGRINYGNLLHDRKGITDAVLLERQMLFGWTIYPLPLDDLSELVFENTGSRGGDAQGSSGRGATRAPSESFDPGTGLRFYRGSFQLDEPADTFLDPDGWTKGVCWINGRNIGRYWNRGPQRTLYVPAPFLCKGANEIVLLELNCARPDRTVSFPSQPVLGEEK